MRVSKEYYLKKILESQEFTGSSKYQDLLTYLYESATKGVIPKEVTIAMEVFGADPVDMGDQNIRIYIYNLRKKLATYYLKEGAEDNIQFTIPKGRYKLEMVQKYKKASQTNRYLLIAVIILALVTASTTIFLALESRNMKVYRNLKVDSDLVWKDFIDNKLPVLVVIGDYYLSSDLAEPDRIRFTRDIHVNSDEDLVSYLQGNKRLDSLTARTRLTMLGKYAPVCINDISRFFLSAGVEYEIILGSEFKWKDLQNTNLIFIGSYKTMNYMKEFFRAVNFEYVIYPNELKFSQLGTDSVFQYFSKDSDIDNAYETDYSILMRSSGMSNSKMMFILASRDIGLMATIDLITDPASLKDFETQHEEKLSEAADFEACFKVEGLYRNVFDIELVNFNAIAP